MKVKLSIGEGSKKGKIVVLPEARNRLKKPLATEDTECTEKSYWCATAVDIFSVSSVAKKCLYNKY